MLALNKDNRLASIQNLPIPSQWRFVNAKDNQADDTSQASDFLTGGPTVPINGKDWPKS